MTYKDKAPSYASYHPVISRWRTSLQKLKRKKSQLNPKLGKKKTKTSSSRISVARIRVWASKIERGNGSNLRDDVRKL